MLPHPGFHWSPGHQRELGAGAGAAWEIPPASPNAVKANPQLASPPVHSRTHGLVCFTVITRDYSPEPPRRYPDWWRSLVRAMKPQRPALCIMDE